MNLEERSLGAIILLVAVALVTSPVRAADTEVKIDNFTFNPQQITVKAGTTVVCQPYTSATH
jgi:plastocyanin